MSIPHSIHTPLSIPGYLACIAHTLAVPWRLASSFTRISCIDTIIRIALVAASEDAQCFLHDEERAEADEDAEAVRVSAGQRPFHSHKSVMTEVKTNIDMQMRRRELQGNGEAGTIRTR